jgi:sugar phosphate isomerase/epimerase
MRLGAPIFSESDDFEEQALAHVKKGYRAAYCPKGLNLDDSAAVSAVEAAYKKHDVLIAEVGVWNNPLDPDKAKAKAARDFAVQKLALADALGARCCVNVLGSLNTENWGGAACGEYGDDFFGLCVEVYRDIIDAVKPVRTKMSFEMMPYYFLDGPDEYLRFLKALNRPQAGVHLDITNCICSPRRYYNNTSLIEETFQKLGPLASSCHLKDIWLYDEGWVVQFREVPAGAGAFDIARFLRCAGRYGDRDLPVMLEHLDSEAAYDAAFAHVNKVNGG